MESMKRLLLLLSFSGVLASSQDLSGVHSVYLLPMSQGLDQYLANRLTNEGIFRVVTNPKLADAIFTDRIGEAFEETLADLSPNPEPVSPPADKQPSEETPNNSLLGDTVNKLSNPATHSSFGRNKGTFFLVNPKSHQVLWSVFQPPRDSRSAQLNRTASDIVNRLKRDLKQK